MSHKIVKANFHCVEPTQGGRWSQCNIAKGWGAEGTFSVLGHSLSHGAEMIRAQIPRVTAGIRFKI